METKSINFFTQGKVRRMSFDINKYRNGNLYVGLLAHIKGQPTPWQNLTVNLGIKCKENCAYIDTNNNEERIIDWLTDNKLGHVTGKTRSSGFWEYPEFEFDMKTMLEYVPKWR